MARTNLTRSCWIIALFLIFAVLAFMASSAGFSQSRLQEGDKAIAAANRLIESVGGRMVWAKARSLYVKERAFPMRIQGPISAEFWRDLEQPAYRSHLTGPGLDRVEVWDEKRGWRVREGQFSWMTEEQVRTEVAGWRQEPYTIYHRLARRDPALRLELTAENQLEIFDPSGHKLCWFVLDATGAPIKWGNIFDGRLNEHLYGPMKRFGEFKMPAWGTSTDGSWRFEYVEIRLSEKPLALPTPPPMSETGGTIRMGTSGAAPEAQLAGEWVGGTDALGNWRFIQARFAKEPNGWAGSLDAQSANVMRLPMANVELNDTGLRFELPTPLGRYVVEGQLKEGRIAGVVTAQTGAKAKLHLVRVPLADQPEPKINETYAGVYRAAPDQTVLVTPRPHGQLSISIMERLGETETLRRNAMLIPQAEATFFTSGSVLRAPDANELVRFERDGKGGVRSLVWQQKSGDKVSARKTEAMRQEMVQFKNGAITLNGTLLLPAGTGPHPAMVIVSGSGATTRDRLWVVAVCGLR